jgi:OTU domain-containing protein 5
MTVTLPIVHTKAKRGTLTIQASAGPVPRMPVRASTTPSQQVQNQRGKLKSYNSIDEYHQFSAAASEDYRRKDIDFEQACLRKGWSVKRMGEDGNCFFRSMADQLYGNQERHLEIRAQCMAFMEKHRDLFTDFILEDFNDYVRRKKQPSTYANNVEIQACACAYDRVIKVFKYDVNEPFADVSPFIEEEGNIKADQRAPLMISYHRSNHFNSLVTPYYHK